MLVYGSDIEYHAPHEFNFFLFYFVMLLNRGAVDANGDNNDAVSNVDDGGGFSIWVLLLLLPLLLS